MDGIPPEILCNIFLAALPHPTDRREYLSSVVAPLRISHVCRSWRTLSLSSRELWSYLCIEYGPSFPNPTAQKSVFDTWIKRTNGALLNFRVECRCHRSEDTTIHRIAEHIITTMVSQQHRWRDVTLTCRDVDLSPEFPGLNLTNMSTLASLALDLRLPLRAKINIARSSRLKRLYICAETDFDLMTGDEPLCSFTESAEIIFRHEIASGRHTLRILLDILKVAPFLTEFIAYSQRYKNPPPLPRAQSEPLIHLPNLRVLKLLESDNYFDHGSFLVDYVTLPNLQVLFLCCGYYDKDVKAETLASFIRRSLPPLTTLVLDWDDVREELILPILRLLPTLKYLRLSGVSVTRRFFHELTIPSDTGAIGLLGDEHAAACPVLETLCLQCVRFEKDADSWVALVAMLKSRPRGLGKSGVMFSRDGFEVSATVELSDLDENIGEYRRVFMERIPQWRGVVIGNFEAVKSLTNH